MMDCSVIIVNWNVKEELRSCLYSIEKEKGGIPFEVFVVDNASWDGSVEMVRKEFPWIRIIANFKNLGFARGCNQAIRASQGKYLLLLNPDTKILPMALSGIVAYLNDHPRVGILGGKILNPDGSPQPSVRRFPTFGSQVLILLKLHHLFPRLKPLRTYLCHDFDYSKEQDVDQVMGAFLAIRRKTIEEVGFFDEQFWLWFEEVDLCKRTREKGWKIRYIPTLQIIHAGSRSFKKLSPLKRQTIFNRSMLLYFRKHHSFISWSILQCLTGVSVLLALLVQLIQTFHFFPKKNFDP